MFHRYFIPLFIFLSVRHKHTITSGFSPSAPVRGKRLALYIKAVFTTFAPLCFTVLVFCCSARGHGYQTVTYRVKNRDTPSHFMNQSCKENDKKDTRIPMLIDDGSQHREVLYRGVCYRPYREQAAQKRRLIMCLECRELCKVNKRCSVMERGKVGIKEQRKQPKFESSYLWLRRKNKSMQQGFNVVYLLSGKSLWLNSIRINLMQYSAP